MKKKLLLVIMTCLLAFPMSVSAEWWEDNTFTDPLNNDLYEVVAPLQEGTPKEGSKLIHRVKGCFVETGELDFMGVPQTVYANYEVYDDGTIGKPYMGVYSVTHDDEIDSGDEMTEDFQIIYNDGYVNRYLDEEWAMQYSVADVNGQVRYKGLTTGSIYSADFNLGYVVESGIMEETRVTNLVSGEEYWFHKCRLETFGNDGYSILYIYKESSFISGVPDEMYLIRLKKPALTTVYLDGKKIGFDQTPVIEDGRTLVPLRAIFEAFGAEVGWGGATQTVSATKGNTTVELIINNTVAKKNGEELNLDVPAKIINGRTMVPVRFISDCFGIGVEWDGAMNRVLLSSN